MITAALQGLLIGNVAAIILVVFYEALNAIWLLLT